MAKCYAFTLKRVLMEVKNGKTKLEINNKYSTVLLNSYK